jgi:hypothetical protein
LFVPPNPPGICQHPFGSTTLRPVRALTIPLDEWADKGIEPPPSNYPRLEDGNLVSLEEYRKAFPSIPGVEPPSVMDEINVMNFGPLFDSGGGVQTLLPPVLGPGYAIFVPKPDKDGIGVGGINPLTTRVPLGTNVGWNVQAGFRAPDLCGLNGAFFPFARTQAERLATGDSRESLEERYGDHQGFVDAVTKGANELVQERFMLEEDAQTYIQAAENSDVLR